jgi:hypothetical protein
LLAYSLLVDSFIRINKQPTKNIMVWAFKRLVVTLAVLFFLNGCQAMTGETAGQNLDDGVLTTSVKSSLASEKLGTLTRVGVETDNAIVHLTGEVETAEEKARIGSIASRVKGVKRVVNNLQVIKR